MKDDILVGAKMVVLAMLCCAVPSSCVSLMIISHDVAAIRAKVAP